MVKHLYILIILTNECSCFSTIKKCFNNCRRKPKRNNDEIQNEFFYYTKFDYWVNYRELRSKQNIEVLSFEEQFRNEIESEIETRIEREAGMKVIRVKDCCPSLTVKAVLEHMFFVTKFNESLFELTEENQARIKVTTEIKEMIDESSYLPIRSIEVTENYMEDFFKKIGIMLDMHRRIYEINNAEQENLKEFKSFDMNFYRDARWKEKFDSYREWNFWSTNWHHYPNCNISEIKIPREVFVSDDEFDLLAIDFEDIVNYINNKPRFADIKKSVEELKDKTSNGKVLLSELIKCVIHKKNLKMNQILDNKYGKLKYYHSNELYEKYILRNRIRSLIDDELVPSYNEAIDKATSQIEREYFSRRIGSEKREKEILNVEETIRTMTAFESKFKENIDTDNIYDKWNYDEVKQRLNKFEGRALDCIDRARTEGRTKAEEFKLHFQGLDFKSLVDWYELKYSKHIERHRYLPIEAEKINENGDKCAGVYKKYEPLGSES